MTFFTARSNLVPYAFVSEKGKPMDFSETIVANGVKVGRCSQQMSTWTFLNIKGQIHSLTLVQGHSYFPVSFP